MKKLKHSEWFNGYDFPIIIALLTAPNIGALSVLLLYKQNRETPPAVALTAFFCISAAAFFLCLLLFYLWFHRLTPEEREQIANAEPVQWRGSTEEERRAVRHLKDDSILSWLLVVMLLPAGLIGLNKSASKAHFTGKDMALGCGILAVVIAAVFCITRAITRFWKGIDETAETAEIPVTRCFTRTKRRRYGGKYYRHYAVCYLPDGKYVFRINRAQADKLIVIRYKRHTCILTPDIPEYDDD